MNETDDLRFEQVNYTVRETGTEIRRALRDAFPGVKFSLRGSRGTGYGWFSLSWTDGPTTRAVDAVTNRFRSSYFDGMDDSTHTIPATMYADADGVIREHRYSCDGVNTERSVSTDARSWAESYVNAHGGPELFCSDYWPDMHIAVHRVLSGINLCGIDWATVPDPTTDHGTGRRVAASYCLETIVYDYPGQEQNRHRADA